MNRWTKRLARIEAQLAKVLPCRLCGGVNNLAVIRITHELPDGSIIRETESNDSSPSPCPACSRGEVREIVVVCPKEGAT